MSTTGFDSGIVTGMLDEAIDYCTRKAGLPDRAQTVEALRCGNCAVCEYLRYGLARGVAEYLGSLDGAVKAVYSYDPDSACDGEGSGVERPNCAPGINLIAWVSRKSAALSSVVALLRSSMAQEQRRLECPRANALCHALDIHIVDDEEALGKTVYGALLSSLYVRPVEIWRRST